MHIAEEYWFGGGYSAYLKQLRGIDMSEKTFLMAQGIGMVLLITALLIARRLRFPETMLVILGAVVTANATSHVVTSTIRFEYGPGLITAILVWLPLGFATLIRFHGKFGKARYWMAVVIGISINVVILLFTLRGGI
jgi:hypothetical protein